MAGKNKTATAVAPVIVTVGTHKQGKGTSQLLHVDMKSIDLKGSSIAKGGINARSDIGDIAELAANIKTNGLLQPPVLVAPAAEGGTYQVVVGMRRLSAMKELGWEKVPAIILPSGSDISAAVGASVAEQISKADLPPGDIAAALKKLTEANGDNASKAAKAAGMSRTMFDRYMRYNELDAKLRKLVDSGDMSLSAAIETVRLDDDIRPKVLKRIEGGETAQTIKRYQKEIEDADKAADPEAAAAKKKGKKAKKGKRGKTGRPASDVVLIYVGKREEQATLRKLCYALMYPDAEDKGNLPVIFGAVAALLWRRGQTAVSALDAGDVKGAVPFLPVTLLDANGLKKRPKAADRGEISEAEWSAILSIIIGEADMEKAEREAAEGTPEDVDEDAEDVEEDGDEAEEVDGDEEDADDDAEEVDDGD